MVEPYRVHPFTRYALLGDDIVIADPEVAENYRLLLRFLGGVRSKIDSPNHLSPRWRRILIGSEKPHSGNQLPLEWWIGRNRPISPYFKGILVDLVREEFKPKDLKLPPDLEDDWEIWLTEPTLIRSWMLLWLKWLLWYSKLFKNPDPTFEDLFNPPIVPTMWRRSLNRI